MKEYLANLKRARIPLIAIIATLGLLTSSCSSSEEAAQTKLNLVGNFYPVSWLVEQIAGEGANVSSLTPDGAEPHDLQLDAQSLALIQGADLVFYLGSEFQPDLEKAMGQLDDPTKAVDLLKSPGLKLLDAKEEDRDHSHEGEEDHDHSHEGEEEAEHKHPLAGGKDPHVWLDPANMIRMAGMIFSELKRISPTQEEKFASNRDSLIGSLNSLDQEFTASLSNCKVKTLVTSHEAFLYLTDKYGFEQVAIAGISPEDEPDAKRLASISKIAKETGVTHVYFEDVLPTGLSETVANEIGAKLSLLSALEFNPTSGDYLSQMRMNLSSIIEGQGCQN